MADSTCSMEKIDSSVKDLTKKLEGKMSEFQETMLKVELAIQELNDKVV